MNNLQMVITLVNAARKLPFLNKFVTRRNNNRGMIWASVIGIGISLVALALRNKDFLQPIQDQVVNFMDKRPIGNNPVSVMAEFSNELNPTNIKEQND